MIRRPNCTGVATATAIADNTRAVSAAAAQTGDTMRDMQEKVETIAERSLSLGESSQKIGEILDRIYPQPPIPLQHADPFTLLVAVVLSAQTTDAQVNKVTPDLFRKAKTPAEMAALPERTILTLIRSCGLSLPRACVGRQQCDCFAEHERARDEYVGH